MGEYKEVGFYISVDKELEFIETGSHEVSMELVQIYLQSKKIEDYVIFKNGIKLDEEAETNLKLLGLKMYNRIIEYPKDTYSTIVRIRLKNIQNNEIKIKEPHLNERLLETEEKELVIESDFQEKENISDEIETKGRKNNYFSQLGLLPKILAILAYPFGAVILFFLISFRLADIIYSIFGAERYMEYDSFNILDIRYYIYMHPDLRLTIFFLLLIIILIIYSRFLFKKH